MTARVRRVGGRRRTIPYTARVPRNPSGEAGPDVVPPSTDDEKVASEGSRPRGPKRPPRPKRPPAAGTAPSEPPSKRPAKAKQADATPNGTSKPTTDAPRREVTDGDVTDRDGKPGAGADQTRTDPDATPVPGTGPSTATVVAPRDVASRPAVPAPAAVRAKRAARTDPNAAPLERTTGNRRGRRVTRVVRRIELWSVLKLSLVLFTCLYLAVLGMLVVVWGFAYSSGQIERLQEFLTDVGLENFRFYGDRMFKATAAIGAVAVLAGTVLTVLTTSLINLISEMTGGIRVVVIEEERRPRR